MLMNHLSIEDRDVEEYIEMPSEEAYNEVDYQESHTNVVINSL